MLTQPQPHARPRDSLPADLIETVQAAAPLPPRDAAGRMIDAYFDNLHGVYPILHRPTLVKMLDQMYVAETDAASSFQVFMVLALGSTSLSTRLPAESYGLAALRYFDKIHLENSLSGLQCLLLLLLFALHCPHVRVNVWHLNYQAIAAVVDLGLQRDITSGITLLEQEMRTRIFWVVFMLDRVIATTMGRPIGLRDEACDLRVCTLHAE